MNPIARAAHASTCQKRVTVCAIFDADNRPLAVESNRCAPDGGRCHRLAISNAQSGYPSTSECNWQHAEQRATKAVPDGAGAAWAVLIGHEFPCADCEAALRGVGVTHIEVIPSAPYCGLRALSGEGA